MTLRNGGSVRIVTRMKELTASTLTEEEEKQEKEGKGEEEEGAPGERRRRISHLKVLRSDCPCFKSTL